MPTDLRMTEDRDIEPDHTGDYASVSGRDNIRQQHANALFRAAERVRSSLGVKAGEEDFLVETRRELRSLPYMDRIVKLEITESGRRSVEITVETNATEEPLTEEV